jgi:pilus assembly protein Flp/PilA
VLHTLRRGDGQGLAEYALILALIALVAIAALTFLGVNLSDELQHIGDEVHNTI